VFVGVKVAMGDLVVAKFAKNRPGWEIPKYCHDRTGSIVLFRGINDGNRWKKDEEETN
jgi:hypothetical protein